MDRIEAIARTILDIQTLEERGRDALDFHDVHVTRLRAALEAAYNQGRTDALDSMPWIGIDWHRKVSR